MALRVAVIGGGDSDEAEISRISAQQVLAGIRATHTAEFFEFNQTLGRTLLDYAPDVAVPVMHGPRGEDGTVQGLLSALKVPFVGSDLHASALGMDKHASKLMFADAGLSVLPSATLRRGYNPDEIAAVQCQLGHNLVVKPINQGSALGVTLLPTGGDLETAVEQALQYSVEVLIEPFIQGREITVGILDLVDKTAIALPVIDIQVPNDEWYDFHNRYTVGKSKHVIPPEGLDAALLEQLARSALQAHACLGCADLSRCDYIVTESGEIWLLELNTMPGMTPTSLYPDAARAHGLEFETLMRLLVESGHQRGMR